MAEEQELIRRFDIMVSEESDRNEPTQLFAGWNDNQKVSYMKQLEFNLPGHHEAANLENMDVPDSVLFDVTDPKKAQQNYESSIGHYRSWQYGGSDRRFEFGAEKRQRAFVTRSTGTFVFYYQCDDLLVGLIIDGQRGWAEGAITRNRRDGSETVLQFARPSSDPDYIRSQKTHTLKFDENYTKGQKIYKIKLGVWQLRETIKAIGEFVPGVSKYEPEPVHWQILVLFGPEAGRVNYVFGRTSKSLAFSNGVPVIIQIPVDVEAFVLSYLKLSRCGIAVLDGKPFVHVKGTTPRNLYQILLAVLILRRNVVYPTHFMLPDAPPMRVGPDQGNRGNALMGVNAKGTTYQVGKHDGTATYHSEEWLTHPFEQVNSQTLVRQEHHGLHKLDLTKGQNVTQQNITSTFIVCPERLIGDLLYQEGLHHKKDKSQGGGRCFSIRESDVAEKTQEELLRDHPTRKLPLALGTVNSKVPEIMKKRAITRETDSMDACNKKAKLMVVEHEQRCCVTRGNLFDKTSGFHASFEEDANSRKVLMTNVHSATKEALPMHLMERRAKGAAYATCADRESIERATSWTLGRRSHFSRFDTVMRPSFQRGQSPLPATCYCD